MPTKTPPISTILFSVLLFLGSAFIAFLVITSNFSVEVNKFFASSCTETGQFDNLRDCEGACGQYTGPPEDPPCFFRSGQGDAGCYKFSNDRFCNGDGGGGGGCDQSQLSASFAGGSVTITNGSDGACEVHATSWKIYDQAPPEFLNTQVRNDFGVGTVGGHNSVTFNLAIPGCSYQLDAGTGAPPDNAHYSTNYIDGAIIFTDYLCDGTCIGQSCQPTPPPTTPPSTPQPPIGSFDEVTCIDLQGWARDPDTDPLPSNNNGPVHVTIWNGPATQAGTNLLAEVIADRPREPAVGNHAFLWPIPAALKNGQTYNFYVYARDNQDPAVSTLLIGSPRTLDTSTCLTPTHLECVSNACTQVAGAGTDTCSIAGSSCGVTPTHLECVNNSCTSVSGAGTNTCSILGSSCGTTPTHLECVNNSCTQVSGAGTDACSPAGSSCGVTPTHLECVSNACTQVAGAGTDACTPAGSSCGVTTHLECVNNSCTSVSGAGTNTCSPVGSSCGVTELVCAPTSQNTTSGAQAQFTATGGRSPYVWSATGGNPSSFVGNPFRSAFMNTNATPRTFTATVTDQDGRTDFCTVTVSCPAVTCTPPSGCSYQGGNACSCGTLVCPSDAPLVCAPLNQTVSIGQSAVFQAAGGSGSYTWTAPGSATFSPSGPLASSTYSSAGSYTVTVRDSQNRTASCAVLVPPATVTPPPTSPALTIAKTVRNVTTNSPDMEVANADPSQTVEFTIRVSSVGTGTATQVVVRDTLPAGLTYSAGTTTIDGAGAADGITGSGLLIGDMAPGRVVVIRFRAVLATASFFGNGTTTLINTAFARGSNTSEVSDNAQVRIVRGTTTPTQVPTGPGESAILALIVSAIATLLYVGYASTESFSRHEAESLARKGKDNIDSLDFRR